MAASSDGCSRNGNALDNGGIGNFANCTGSASPPMAMIVFAFWCVGPANLDQGKRPGGTWSQNPRVRPSVCGSCRSTRGCASWPPMTEILKRTRRQRQGQCHSRPSEASAYKPIFALASSMSSSKAEAMAVSRSRVARWWIIAARVLERPILAIGSFRVAPLSAYQVLPV